MEKWSIFITEKIDRAILMHENENRHELSTPCDIPDSAYLYELEAELKGALIDILS